MKEPVFIQISDENNKTKLLKKDHNYFSVEEECGVLMSGRLAGTRDENGDLDKNALESSVSGDFQDGEDRLLSLQSENEDNRLLSVDVTRETSRTNRPRFDTRFRTNSSDSAFSEDSLIDLNGDEDGRLDSLIDQLIFYSDDLQTYLSSYVKPDSNAALNDVDGFDVNDLFCSDVVCDDAQPAAENVYYSEGPRVVKPQRQRSLMKPGCSFSFPTAALNKCSELDPRRSINHTESLSQLTGRSDVAASLNSVSSMNPDILKMAFSHKAKPQNDKIIISSPTTLTNLDNYDNPGEYCVIDIDGNVQKDNTEIVCDYMKSSTGGEKLENGLKKIKAKFFTEGSVSDLNSPQDVPVRNDLESDTLKGGNPLLQPLWFFDGSDSHDDVKKGYKTNNGMVFGRVFEPEFCRLQKNGLKVPEDVGFDKHIDMKTDSCENTGFSSEEFMMGDWNERTISNKDCLKSVLKDLFRSKEYFEQEKMNSLSPTEQKASIEDFNTRLLRSLDVLAILSPQSQGSNDTDMLIEPAENEHRFNNIQADSLVGSNQKDLYKKASVHNMDFLTQNPQQPEETNQDKNTEAIIHESEMTDGCFGSPSVCNTEVDFGRSTDPNERPFKKISEEIERKFPSNDSDNKQSKVPRLYLNRKHSVDSALIEGSLLRKVLTGKLTSTTPFLTKEKQKCYQTLFQETIDFSDCPILKKSFTELTNKFPRDKTIGMSELEKYLRGLIPTVANNETIMVTQETNGDLERRYICPKYPGRSFLKRLLTGELNSDTYYKIDARLCKQERFTQLVRRMNKAAHCE